MVEINDLSTTDDSNTDTGWTEGMLPSAVNNSARKDLGLLARWIQHMSGEGSTATNTALIAGTGTAINSLSVSLARSSLTNTLSGSASTGYVDGLTLLVEVPSTITAVPVLGINGKASHPIVDSGGTTLSSSMILAGTRCLLTFDATPSAPVWQMLNPTAGGGNVITARGSIIYGDATGRAAELVIGADGTGPLSDGTDIAMAGLVKQGTHSLWIPANAMVSRTDNGASAGITETSAQKVMINTMNFADGADDHAQFTVQMPKSWDAGTVTAQFVWSHAAATTFGVRFFIQGVSFSDGDALDTAFGTAVGHAADAGGVTNDVYITDPTAAVTIAAAAKSEYVVFQIYRDVDDVGDTLDVAARLHGVTINYTIDAADDA